MRGYLVAAIVLCCASDAHAAKKKKKPNKQQQELLEQSRRNKEAAEAALRAAEEAKRSADEAKQQLHETKTADEMRRAEEQQKRADEERRRSEEAARAAAEDAAKKQQADAEKLTAEEAAKKAAADAAEVERLRLENEARAYVHVFYMRAHGGVEMYSAAAVGTGSGLRVAPAFGGGLGYRLGVVRLGAEYQGTLALGEAAWHKALFNTEIVLGSRTVEFFIRIAAGYGVLLPGAAAAQHGGAGKAGLGIDFRVVPAFAFGLGADFDALLLFPDTGMRFLPSGTGFARISIFL